MEQDPLTDCVRSSGKELMWCYCGCLVRGDGHVIFLSRLKTPVPFLPTKPQQGQTHAGRQVFEES